MNCCDDYGNCNQGRDCPVRKQMATEKMNQDKQDDHVGDPAEGIVNGVLLSIMLWGCIYIFVKVFFL
jgi:hypothetical protein